MIVRIEKFSKHLQTEKLNDLLVEFFDCTFLICFSNLEIANNKRFNREFCFVTIYERFSVWLTNSFVLYLFMFKYFNCCLTIKPFYFYTFFRKSHGFLYQVDFRLGLLQQTTFQDHNVIFNFCIITKEFFLIIYNLQSNDCCIFEYLWARTIMYHESNYLLLFLCYESKFYFLWKWFVNDLSLALVVNGWEMIFIAIYSKAKHSVLL